MGIFFFWFGGILGSASSAKFPVSLSNHVGFTPRLLYSSTHHSSESFIPLKTDWAQDAWLQWSHENWYFHLDISRWRQDGYLSNENTQAINAWGWVDSGSVMVKPRRQLTFKWWGTRDWLHWCLSIRLPAAVAAAVAAAAAAVAAALPFVSGVCTSCAAAGMRIGGRRWDRLGSRRGQSRPSHALPGRLIFGRSYSLRLWWSWGREWPGGRCGMATFPRTMVLFETDTHTSNIEKERNKYST